MLRYAGAGTSLTLCSSLEHRGSPSTRVIHPVLQPLRVSAFILDINNPPVSESWLIDRLRLVIRETGSGSVDKETDEYQKVENNGEG